MKRCHMCRVQPRIQLTSILDLQEMTDWLSRRNLAEVLPYLRYEYRIRTLWIDAICINQQDLRERSSQVKIMGDIYRLADRVVIWLGSAKDKSAHALKILSQLISKSTTCKAQCRLRLQILPHIGATQEDSYHIPGIYCVV